jgi:predicted chitinase
LDIDGLQSRILDRLDLRTPEGSAQDIQYGLGSQKLGEPTDDEDQPDIKFDTPDSDSVDAIPKPELGGLMAPKGRGSDLVFAQAYLGVKVDNKFGPGTSRALAAFQYRNNIPISGQVDDETIKAMKNPDTLDPREATIKVNDVLNAEGTRPDIEKLKAWSKKNIKDPLRAAAFVATVEAESARGLTELGYTKKGAIEQFPTRASDIEDLPDNASADDIFNTVYGGRFGNTEPNDGATYKGRGLVQLTFKGNYRDVGNILGLDLVNNPELVNDPKHAVAVAMTYLTLPGRNFFTGEINQQRLAQIIGHGGGTTEAEDRFERAEQLKREMYN